MPTENDTTPNPDRQRVRSILASLGFDTIAEAGYAVRSHSDFGARWDLSPDEVETLTAWKSSLPALRQVNERADCSCDPFAPKWAKGYRDECGYLTCCRCNGRIH